MPSVGARGVVHTPQFNGKQEGRVARSTTPNLRCPRNGQTDELLSSAFVTKATGRLEQATGKATKVASVSPDTGQQGGGAFSNAPLERSSTVGEGGESTQLLVFFHEEIFCYSYAGDCACVVIGWFGLCKCKRSKYIKPDQSGGGHWLQN
jgi:hypothetical protein